MQKEEMDSRDRTAEKVRTLCASSDELCARWADAGFVMANSTRSAHSCSMKITEDVRKHAPELGAAEEEALKRGLEENSKEFAEKSVKAYARA